MANEFSGFSEWYRSMSKHPEHWDWHEWFAWHPVRTARGIAFLGRVQRKKFASFFAEGWVYREIGQTEESSKVTWCFY